MKSSEIINLNDIWRNVNKEIDFFTKDTFSQVPSVPGIYGWFYPLRILTHDPLEFVKEVNVVLNYDAISRAKPSRTKEIDFGWRIINQKLEFDFKNPNLENFIEIWKNAINKGESYNHLRRVIMKASLFMPPLYVGKTLDLKSRCLQHINGMDIANDFNKRYSSFTKKNEIIKAKKVSDLLFVCVKTIDENRKGKHDELEKLVEEIIKNLSKPAYSLK